MKKIEVIRSFYESKLNRGLPDFAVLGWEGKDAQNRRFEVLASRIDLRGLKLLDVGCGLGNLLEYLLGRGIRADYTGVDLSEKIILCAKDKKLPGDFRCLDIFKSDSFEAESLHKESFDVVFASGIFNINLGNNKEFLKKGLTRFFELSRRFVAFNLLHVYSPDREDAYAYFSPDEVVEMIDGLPFETGKVETVEGYLNNDFTIICEKRMGT